MFQYSHADKERIDNVVAKARAEKPHVRPVAFGRFEVEGSQPGSYHLVTFGKNGYNEFVISCDCPAGQNGKPCYHAAAAAGPFKLQVADRAEARQRISRPNGGGGWTSRLEPVVSQDTLAKDKADIFG